MKGVSAIIVLAAFVQTEAKEAACGFSEENWEELCKEMKAKHETPEDLANVIKADVEKKLQEKGPFLASLIKSELGDICSTADVANACGVNSTSTLDLAETSDADEEEEPENVLLVGVCSAMLGSALTLVFHFAKQRKRVRSPEAYAPLLVA